MALKTGTADFPKKGLMVISPQPPGAGEEGRGGQVLNYRAQTVNCFEVMIFSVCGTDTSTLP